MMKIVCILSVFIYSVHSIEVLRHVHAIFRHGDRSPTHLFSDNINKTKMWPFGFGQLTDIGMRQHFALGKWLRSRYRHLLSKEYCPEEIRIRSTDVDRTLMSAQSNLAALYYGDYVQIAPNLFWRPIPVHTIPRVADTLSLPKGCNKYSEAIQELYKSTFYQSAFSEYQATLDLMRNVSKNNKLGFEDFWYIFDSLFCERSHGITLDPWVTEEVYQNISKMYAISWKMLHYGDKLGRLSGGRFLDEIVKEMTEFANNSNIRKDKFQMISGHDTDLGALLSAIGIYDGLRPPYASCLMIELIHSPTNDQDFLKNWVVKLYFKTTVEQTPHTIGEQKLKGCPSQPCTLGDFIEFVRPRTISLETYQKLCD